MKIFRRERGKKVVYVQEKDLILISKLEYIKDKFKNYLPKAEGQSFIKIDDQKLLEELEKIEFIIDFDQYKKLSEEEIYEKADENRLQIDRIVFAIKRSNQENKKSLIAIHNLRENYAQDLVKCLQYKKLKINTKKLLAS